MKYSTIARFVPALAAAALAGLMGLTWLGAASRYALKERLAGDEAVFGPEAATAAAAGLPGELIRGQGAPADLPGAWPMFRGPSRDGISTETVPLIRSFGPEGPPRLWSVDMGEGYAAAAVLNGRVYVLDYDQAKRGDALRCLSLADGQEIWRRWYPIRIKRQHGISRTIPAVTEKFVLTVGPKCHVMCLDALSGDYIWGIDLVKEYGAKVPEWYTGQCPLIDEGRAILAPGAPEALLMAVDCQTGKVIWKTPNPDRWDMTHASVLPMAFGGRRMYVYCGSGGVVGVSADDGQVLWKTTDWVGRYATVGSPIHVGEGRVFLCSGYTAGSIMLQLEASEGQFSVRTLFRLADKVFGSEQQTPVLYQGYLYGTRSDGQFVCLDPAGRIVWASGPANRYGPFGGPYMIADGMILVMDDHGVLSMLEATPEAFRPLAKARVLQGHESWGPMALAGGRLIVRDLTKMICLDMRAQTEVSTAP